MKKLMIAVAIVCAAALAQAATVSWQVKLSSATKILDQTGNSWTKSGTANTGMTAYLVLATDTDAFVDALKNGTSTAAYVLDSSSSFTAATGAMSATKTTPDSAKITTAAQAFNAVLVYTDGNGDDYYQVSSSTASSQARSSAADPASVAFNTGDVFASSQTSWLALSSSGGGDTPTPGTIPEPTSGLLLALGLAGLALRRKRA